jgi:hypothetical protein
MADWGDAQRKLKHFLPGRQIKPRADPGQTRGPKDLEMPFGTNLGKKPQLLVGRHNN